MPCFVLIVFIFQFPAVLSSINIRKKTRPRSGFLELITNWQDNQRPHEVQDNILIKSLCGRCYRSEGIDTANLNSADVLSVVFISPTHFQFNNLLGQADPSWSTPETYVTVIWKQCLCVPLLKIEIFEGITVRVGDIASVGLIGVLPIRGYKGMFRKKGFLTLRLIHEVGLKKCSEYLLSLFRCIWGVFRRMLPNKG